MTRSRLFAALVLGQALILVFVGIATIVRSQDLMTWLIHVIGEDRALGTGNVVHLENGGKLLTNPSAMVRWMVPFWLVGGVQVSAGLTLVYLWVFARRLGRRSA